MLNRYFLASLLAALQLLGCSAPGDDDAANDDDSAAVGDDDSAGDDDSGDDDSGDDDSGDDDSGDDDSAAWTEDQQRGADLYQQFCSLCHGTQGEGYAADEANALSNELFLAAATDDFLRGSISHGRPGTPMSAWAMDYAGPLSPQDIDDIVAFLRTWGEHSLPQIHNTVVNGDPEAGLAVYQQHCASCHGASGQGDTAISIANPWFLELASDGFLLHAIDDGRPGTQMAAWDPVLPLADRHNLVALLRSWATAVDETVVPPFNPDLSDHLLGIGGPPADFTAVLQNGRFVAVEQVWDAYDAGHEFVLLDARPGSDYLGSHISGAVSVPFYRMDEAVGVLPQNRWIVSYCGCPHALSGEAAGALLAAGFTQIAVLDEGYYEWLGNGHPTTAGTARF